MKKGRLIFCTLLLMTTITYAQTDSFKVQKEYNLALEQTVRSIESANNMLKRNNEALKIKLNEQKQTLDSLKKEITQNAENIKITTEQLGVKIKETNVNTENKTAIITQSLKNKTIMGILLAFFLTIVSVLIYMFLHKKIRRGSNYIDVVKQQIDKLNAEIVNQFSTEMVEIQKISTSINALSQSTSTSPETEQILIKTLADRITFMEMTLYKMDNSVRGHKQLSRAIAQMKDNLLANGYELVDMLGKPYHEGMKVTANFIENESLREGEQIITSIIKPQINYKGVMIQSAQITVSQNI